LGISGEDFEMINKVKELIKQNEGVSNQMYICPAGYATIGVGHNLEANPISNRAVEVIFNDDVRAVMNELDRNIFWWRKLPDNAQIALVDLGFNLGVPRLLKFKKTLKYLRAGEFKKASKELLDSHYAKQVHNRAVRNSKLIEECENAQ